MTIQQPRRSIILLAAAILFTAVTSQPARAAEHDSLQQLAETFSATEQERQAGAVVLRHDTQVEVADDLLDTSTTHVAIALLDQAAVDAYSTIPIGYNGYFTELELDFARVIDSDGVVRSVADDSVQVKTDSGSVEYNEIKELTFSLPAMSPGAIIEYQYRTRAIRLPIEGYWYERWSPLLVQFGAGESVRVDPVRNASYRVSLPASVSPDYVQEHLDIKARREHNGNRQTLTWKTHDVAGISIEDRIADFARLMPLVSLSTLSSWQDLDTWGRQYYLAKVVPTEKTRRLAKTITRNAKTPDEKVKALFYYLQDNVRYISADLSRNGLVPHAPDTVLDNRYGDCKDQSTLLVTLLNALDIEAYPALIGTYPSREVRRDLPSNYFNHMVVYLPGIDGGTWIDTAGETGAYPGVSWSIQDRDAFVINGSGGKLQTLPPARAAENQVTIDVDIHTEDDVLYSDIRLTTSGQVSNGLRAWLRRTPQDETELRKMLSLLYSTASIDSFSHNAQADRHIPFSASLRLRFDDAWHENKEVLALDGALSHPLSHFTALSVYPTPEQRKHAFLLGKPVRLTYKTTYHKPDADYGFRIQATPGKLHTAHLRLDSRIERDDESLTVTETLEQLTSKIPAAEYQRFTDDIAKVRSRSRWVISMLKDSSGRTRPALAVAEPDPGSNDPAALIQMARDALSAANYESALQLAQKAVQINDSNGEAHYVLGIAAGFLDDFDLSDQALNRSKELGFKQ